MCYSRRAARGKRKSPTVATWSFRQARQAWSIFAMSPATDEGYLMRYGACDVEDEVVDEQTHPGANQYGAHEQLRALNQLQSRDRM
jgi:hypothetical protein